jgi:NAD(P)-dependent dehydrogenase (short-subunit alcohol dehydrogenase family)
MRIAITGGTGFVGRHLARALVAKGHEVILIARGVDDRDRGVRARLLEATMKIPLVSVAQVRILSDGIVEPLPGCGTLPPDLLPSTFFSDEQIRKGFQKQAHLVART